MKQIEKDGDVVALLKVVRGISREMITNASLYDAIDKSKRKYYAYYQQPEDDNKKHRRN